MSSNRDKTPQPREPEKKDCSKPEPEPEQQVRWSMATLCLGARLTVQANRIILGPMMPFIVAETKWSEMEKGQVLSAFASGYALTQIIGGRMADRIGAKRPLFLALVAVSLGSTLAPLAVDLGGRQALWMNYFLMGLLEGPSYPSIGSLIGKWFPAAEKATANSRTGTGGSIGGLLAIGVGPVLAERFGWRATFVGTGVVSLAFCVAWALRSADKPILCERVSAAELKYLREKGVPGATPVESGSSTAKAFPWKLFTHAPVLACCYAHGVFNFGRYFVYAWIPSFYSDQLGLNPKTAATCMFCLQVADALIEYNTGPVADYILSKGYLSVRNLRRLLTCSGCAGFGLAILLCGYVQSVVAVTILLAIAKAFASLHTSGFKTNYLDLTVQDTGTVVGVGNTLATLASMASPLLAGYVLQHYGWKEMFQVCFLVNISGIIVFGTFASATCLDAPAAPSKKKD